MSSDSERNDIYQRTRDDLLKRHLSNSENRDRAILTLSSAGLALSVTAFRYIVDPEHIIAIPLLLVIWGLFVVAIVLTLISFHVSQRAINVQLKLAEDYYLNKNESALHRRNLPSMVNDWLGVGSTAVFLFAIVCFVVFFSLNMSRKSMTDNKNEKQTTSKSAQIPPLQKLTGDRGASIPPLQPTPGNKVNAGADVPTMQAIPSDPSTNQNQPQHPADTSADTSATSSGNTDA